MALGWPQTQSEFKKMINIKITPADIFRWILGSLTHLVLMVMTIGHRRSHPGDTLSSTPLPQHRVSILQLRAQQNSEGTGSRTIHVVEEDQALICSRTTEGAGQEAGTVIWQHQGRLNVQIMTLKTEIRTWLKHKGVLLAQWTITLLRHDHNYISSSRQWEGRGTNPCQWCGLL